MTDVAGATPADELVPTVQARVTALLRPLLRRWLRLEVEGREHVPMRGPVLIASTHQSHADSPAIGTAVPRPMHFLGDRRLIDWPLLGLLRALRDGPPRGFVHDNLPQ